MRSRDVFACVMWTFRLAITSLASVSSTQKVGSRCFCNEASCVQTGYMCKSLLGICFTFFMPDGHGFRSNHGCVDTLPETSRNACANGGDLLQVDKDTALSSDGLHRLLCCRQDMCNYADGTSIVLLSAIANNNSAANSFPDHDRSTVFQNSSDLNQRDLWFRVAVITVPLIGLFILILLVAAAVRMLRSDGRRHQTARSRDVMAAELYGQLVVRDRNVALSQDICDGFCLNRGYLLCWVDPSGQNCCDVRTCKHQAYVLGSNCARIHPLEKQTFVSIDKCIPAKGKASAFRPSSQVHFPIATV